MAHRGAEKALSLNGELIVSKYLFALLAAPTLRITIYALRELAAANGAGPVDYLHENILAFKIMDK